MQKKVIFLKNKCMQKKFGCFTKIQSNNTKMAAKSNFYFTNPKVLSLAFANAVSVYSTNELDWIARKGEDGLFRILQRLLPEVKKKLMITSLRNQNP